MRAITFAEYGGPEVLREEDVPTPEPGAGQELHRRPQSNTLASVRSCSRPFGIRDTPNQVLLRPFRKANTHHSLVEFVSVEEHGAFIDPPEGTVGR